MSRVIDMTGPIEPHGTSFTTEKLLALKLKAETAEMERAMRVGDLMDKVRANDMAFGRLAYLCSMSRLALRLNDSLQRAYRHDALVAAGVIPTKAKGRAR